MEYFQVLGDNVKFVATAGVDSHAVVAEPTAKHNEVSTKATSTGSRKSEFKRKSQSEPYSTSQQAHLESFGQAPLPVSQEEVSFNLSISAAEQRAKSQVELPYMHQGTGGVSGALSMSDAGSKGCNAAAAGNNTLFFIDEDDPDWDDDDLDDDLEI